MFRLDYLSCFLTVAATILLGRKMWTGLVVSCVNSLVVCVIGLHTSQYGFIPANVFCICINAFNIRPWLRVQKNPPESTTDASDELITGGKRLSTTKRQPRDARQILSESAGKEGSGIRSHLSLSPSTRDIENGIFRPQGIIHGLPATSLPSVKFSRIQVASYRSTAID